MVSSSRTRGTFTNKNTKTVSVEAPEGITVADVFNLIIQKKRDYYIFSLVGESEREIASGCILLQTT